MEPKKFGLILLLIFAGIQLSSAQLTDSDKDSIYIDYVENKKNPAKVLHAEP